MENTQFTVKVNITKYLILLIGGYLLLDGFYNKTYQSIRLAGSLKQDLYIPTSSDTFSRNVTLKYCVYETKRYLSTVHDYMIGHYLLLAVFDMVAILFVSIEQKEIVKYYSILYALLALIVHFVAVTVFICVFPDFMDNNDRYGKKSINVDHAFDIIIRITFYALINLNNYFLHKKEKIFKVIRVN